MHTQIRRKSSKLISPRYFLIALISLLLGEIAWLSWQPSVLVARLTGAPKQGGIRIYPFTQFGPNNQILGTLQALSLCHVLNVECIEPQLSAHSTHTSGAARSLSSLYNISALPFIQLGLGERHLNFILAFIRNDKPCWPGRYYWKNHGLNYTIHTEFQNKILLPWDRRRQSVEGDTLDALKKLQRRALASKHTWNVAYVYCDAMVRPFPATESLKLPFQTFSKVLVPTRKYQAIAESILADFGLLGERYAAIHIRLRDHCDTSFDSCCCYTTGKYMNITSEQLQGFIYELRSDRDIRGVFIAGPPVLRKFVEDWTWTTELGVHTWFADNKSLDSAEESIVHQLLCAKAFQFYTSVHGSTWSNTVEYWMKEDSHVFDMKSLLLPQKLSR